ncbi:farnesyl pyrophosphate synthase [Agrilus planipennis]|uniref:Farnesyl pyrophosphate synthase n=1 Tax=Agrilus planipennis TaxID=224129 RepID=A0A7F5RG34_AGRPL|nr:farnesyl pyrophosphate synthase [Agrilus planipennis]
MFSSFVKLNVQRTSREITKQIERHINKTSSAPNSDIYTLQQNDRTSNRKSNTNSMWLLHQRKHNNDRALSTVHAKISPKLTNGKVSFVSKEESRDFMAVFPDLVRDLTEAGRHTDIPEVTKRFAKVLQYNVPYGKKTRGLFAVKAYKMLENQQNLTPESIRQAIILGWCVQMCQGSLVVLDDVMDNSETRRGVPCWYRNPNIGLSAINDGLLIRSGIYSVLRKYFATHPSYVYLMELFNDTFLKTEMGQALDTMSQHDGKPNLDAFTMKRYNAIVKYKTAYYSFHLPVGLAMYLAGMYDPEQHRQAKTILLEMGHFFQVQDDFLDAFGDPEVTGKIGTDIRDGKCSWLVVVALQRATPSQKKIILENYGKADPEAENAIKKLYEDIGLPNTFAIYEEESYNMIKTHIQQISKGLPHQLFFDVLNKIYRRTM